MNKRIEELAEQAGIHPTNFEPDADLADPLKKLAELIIRECIQVGGPEDSYTDEWFKAKVNSVAKIKQHFGVE